MDCLTLIERIRLLQQINEIVPDSQMRLILTAKFVDDMNWQRVARYVGGNHTSDSVRQQAHRYIKDSDALKKLLECMTKRRLG